MKLTELNPRGTYVGLVPTPTGIDLLSAWAKEHGFELAPDPHVTVLYSRKELPVQPDPRRTFIAQPSGFECFDDDCLVLKLDCQAIHDLHQGYRGMGGTHDYPEFSPHITLAKGSRLKPEDIELPKFAIPLTGEYVEPLDLSK